MKLRFTKKGMYVIYAIAITVIISIATLLLVNFVFNNKLAHVRVTNITTNKVTISWVSERKDNGYVILSTQNSFGKSFFDAISSKKYSDDRGDAKRYTHYVTISNLEPETQYHFRLTNGYSVWDVSDTNQKTDWFDIETLKDFSFTTRAYTKALAALPEISYGSVKISNGDYKDDVIVFAQAYKTDDSGALLENTASDLKSALINKDDGWLLNRADFKSSRKDLSLRYTSKKDMVYVYAQIEDFEPITGTYAVIGVQDNPLSDITYEVNAPTVRKQSLFSKASTPSVLSSNKVMAGEGVCCLLSYEGKKKIDYDYEDSGKCEKLFPVGRRLASGVISGTQEIRGTTRQACESKQVSAGGAYPNTTTPPSSSNFPNKLCNKELDKSKFGVPTINRQEFVSYANRLSGPGSQADNCYEYVVCKARQDGINPAMALNIWVHESAASNYFAHHDVEDMGIHCYAGNEKFPSYVCGTTPKNDLKAQIEMFNALPHTMCLKSTKFDIIMWSAGFWTGSTCSVKHGEKYNEDLKLQWSSYGKGVFPTWIKDVTKAEPNLNCDSGNGGNASPTQSSENTNPNTGNESNGGSSSGSSSNGSSSGSSSGSNSGSSSNGSSSGNNGSSSSGNSSSGSNNGSSNSSNSNAKVPELGIETGTSGESTSGSNNGSGTGTSGEEETPTPAICCAVLTEKSTTFTTKSATTLDCQSTYILGTSDDPTDRISYVTQVKYISEASCNNKSYPIVCENGKAKPEGLSVIGNGVGTWPDCDPVDPKVVGDTMLDIPVAKESIKDIFAFASKVFADTNYVESASNGVVKFTQDGLYNVKVGNSVVNNLPVNSDMTYRFYVNNNDIVGYQQSDDELLTSTDSEITATRVSDVTRFDVSSGLNIVSLPVNPVINGKAMMASELLKYINIEGTKVAYITYYSNNSWADGLRIDENNKGKFLGNDFELKQGVGYLLTSLSEMSDKTALVLPGTAENLSNSYKLQTGWNMITLGSNETKAATYANKVKSSTKSNIVNVSYWSTPKGQYQNLRLENGQVYGFDYEMLKNHIYFIYTEQAGQIDMGN